MDMDGILGIAPLRSLVAVADCGGFQRAASSLHLSQGAVSQHVRRLEGATGRRLVERVGRGSRFTEDGEQLLGHARRILAAHDEALRAFGVEAEQAVVIGSTEHGAAHLLPALAAMLEMSLPEHRVRFRVDRGVALRESIAAGRVDVALLPGAPDDPQFHVVGELALDWFAAPRWQRPAGARPLPVVAFDAPCTLRSRALDTLAAAGVAAVVGAEARQLAGVQAAVGAGLGVALLATGGRAPEGLAHCPGLPPAEPMPVYVRTRRGLSPLVADRVRDAVRQLLAASPTARPGGPAAATVVPIDFARGA